jgi:predicted  nucleic acid-binding Zn-ribbon protein
MNTKSIETALVSRLTQDIEDLRQDKRYLRADVVRLREELQHERDEKERYTKRVKELEELLEKAQKGNSVTAAKVCASLSVYCFVLLTWFEN